jgi:hypothetical protein
MCRRDKEILVMNATRAAELELLILDLDKVTGYNAAPPAIRGVRWGLV